MIKDLDHISNTQQNKGGKKSWRPPKYAGDNHWNHDNFSYYIEQSIYPRA